MPLEDGAPGLDGLAPPPSQVADDSESVRRDIVGIVKLLLDVLGARTPIIAGHSRRTAALCRRIAGFLGLDTASTSTLTLAALVHDIGSVGLSDRVWQKAAGTLSTKDRQIYQEHPVTGEQMLQAVPCMKGVGELVCGHHERWDGGGFPGRLGGREIPLGSRIISIADDFDRVQLGFFHGARLNRQEALRFIADGSGTRYEPNLVRAFLSLFDHTDIQLPPDECEPLALDRVLPGMEMGADLVGPRGLLLLARGMRITERTIESLREIESSEKIRLTLQIRLSPAMRPPAATRRAACWRIGTEGAGVR